MTIQELIRFLDPGVLLSPPSVCPRLGEEPPAHVAVLESHTSCRGDLRSSHGAGTAGLAEEPEARAGEKHVDRAICSINRFERGLSDDGTIIINIFLHISKKEQKKRLLERDTNPLTSWMITKGDWDFHNDYDAYLPVIEKFLKKTDAPVRTLDHCRGDGSKLYHPCLLLNHCKFSRKNSPEGRAEKNAGNQNPAPLQPGNCPVARRSLAPDQRERKSTRNGSLLPRKNTGLPYRLYKRNIPLAIVFEGRDAAGKGRHDHAPHPRPEPPRLQRDAGRGPNDTEKERHYLWRFIRHYPAAGHITIYDRSP